MRAQHISWGQVSTLCSETLQFNSTTSAVHILHPHLFPIAPLHHILTMIEMVLCLLMILRLHWLWNVSMIFRGCSDNVCIGSVIVLRVYSFHDRCRDNCLVVVEAECSGRQSVGLFWKGWVWWKHCGKGMEYQRMSENVREGLERNST